MAISKLQLNVYLILIIGSLAGCIVSNDNNNRLSDYGLESGYYLYVSDKTDTTLESPRKIPLWRDRNHLNIRFHDWVGRDKAEEILKQHELINRFPQSFNDPLEVGNFVRVTENPAEHYYTTYGDTSFPKLGNRSEVEYALPAYYMEDTLGTPTAGTPLLNITFYDHVSIEMQEQWLDSVKRTHDLKSYTLNDGLYPIPPEYMLRISKGSTHNPYTLATQLLDNKKIWETRIELAHFPNGLKPLDN